ncbi:low-specificity L-threonine aldolase [Acrasis kona]|uniref:Low-specificity L-threonine aldolase n=1 Tax=Acrasis kona TaxID=1008807 RepID=A0AAW2ZEE0_9EUKA
MSSLVRVDYRSDTVTRPTQEMLSAMVNAPVGDDVYQDDPTVHQLEKKCADLCGMEAGLFVCSGVMSNQIALRCHLKPMEEVICDHRAHVYRSEQGGIMFHSNASVMPIIPHEGSTHITAQQIEAKINTKVDYHTPISSVISLENTIMGTVVPVEEIAATHTLARKHGLKMHLDGARIWNASTATGIELKQYGQYFDSISLCLSKGLGAPIGSVLVGSKDFIALARRYRKLFGGGWRQAGLLAGAAIYAIDNIWPLLKKDHENAQKLSKGLIEMGFKITVPVETNFVFVNGEDINFSFRHAHPFLLAHGVLITPNGFNCRMAVHHQVTSEGVDLTLSLIKQLITSRFIYRVMSNEDYKKSVVDDHYPGTAQEIKEGFLHFSTKETIRQSAEIYQKGVKDLVLLKIDPLKLTDLDALRWVTVSTRQSKAFPHLHGKLPLSAVVSEKHIPFDEKTQAHDWSESEVIEQVEQ